MKLFSLVFFGLFSIILTNSALDYFLRLSSNLDKGESGVWRDIYYGNLAHNTWVLGSSTAWVQVLPNDNSYNLGMDGYKMNHQLFRLNEAIKYNFKPDRVLWLLDPWSFENQQFGYNRYQTSAFRELDSIRGEEGLLGAFTRYRGCMREFAPIVVREGVKINYRTKGARCVDEIALSLDVYGVKELEFNERLFFEFISTIQDLESAGINCDVIYVEPHESVRNFYSNIETIEKKLVGESSLELKLIPNTEFSENDYYNAMHLNCSGASKLTRLLIE